MMSPNPLVSIIIPCYNYAQYVGQAIASALRQTYSPVEIIVVNDGSTDQTIQVVSNYPVICLTQPNQGQAQACNNGVRECHGDLIVLLSADDLLHPLFLERTVPLLAADPNIAFVYTHGLTFGDDPAIVLAQASTMDALKWGNNLIATYLIRKSVYQAVGGYDPTLRYSEDWDFALRLAENGYRGLLVPQALVCIRAHETSLRNRTSTIAAEWATRRIWQKHPHIFSPGFILQWRFNRWLRKLLHLGVLKFRGSQPMLYERLRRGLRFLRPRAPDLEHARRDDGYTQLVPPFKSEHFETWGEVMRQWA
jgi:glycosyltransferase involved in cell wall biosynthesis